MVEKPATRLPADQPFLVHLPKGRCLKSVFCRVE